MITPTRLAELRRVAEAAKTQAEEYSVIPDSHLYTFTPKLCLALLAHIAAQDRALEVARDTYEQVRAKLVRGSEGGVFWREQAIGIIDDALASLQAEMDGGTRK